MTDIEKSNGKNAVECDGICGSCPIKEGCLAPAIEQLNEFYDEDDYFEN